MPLMEAAVHALAAVEEERPVAPRYQAADIPSITGIRLSPFGIKAVLVDISTTGILVECKTGLQPGSAVSVTFEGDKSLGTVSGRVVRSTVVAFDRNGILRYGIGIAFLAPIPLAVPPTPPEAVAQPEGIEQEAVQAQPIPRNRW